MVNCGSSHVYKGPLKLVWYLFHSGTHIRNALGDEMTIPCPNCPWQNPMLETIGYEVKHEGWDGDKAAIQHKLMYKLRCLKCKWEGEISIPCEVKSVTELKKS